MWIQFLAPLVMLAAVALLLQGIHLGRQSQPAVTQVGADRIARRVAFALALIPSLLLLAVPVYSGLREVANTGGGGTTSTAIRGTLLEGNGLWAVVILAVPVVITTAGLAAGASPKRRIVLWEGALILSVFVFLGAFSVGLAYLPSAAALWIAALLTPGSSFRSRGGNG